MRPLLLCALALTLTACPPKKIGGTDIDDTSDTRAILDLVSQYRQAVEARSAQQVIALVDESFRDDGGSPLPDDDLDYKTLFTALPARFQRLDDVRLDVTVRRVEFDETQTSARVTYSYTLTFRMPSLTARTQSETDMKQMRLKKVADKGWKIVSGI
jgi:hypothetical protein